MKLTRIRQPVRLLTLLSMLLMILAAFGPTLRTASAQPSDPGQQKVFVCKYVGTPNVDERLQEGNNPISVAVSAIPDYQGIGSYFADAQGRSYVLAEDNSNGGGQTGEPSVDQCPRPLQLITVIPAVTVIDATCAIAPSITPVAVAGITYGVVGNQVPGGIVTVTATINPATHVWGALGAGWVPVNASTATYTYTFANPDCRSIVMPAGLQVTQATCVAPAALTLPPNGGGIAYTTSGTVAAGQIVTVTATITDPTLYIFAADVSPWTRVSDTVATASVTFTVPTGCEGVTPSPSPTPVTPGVTPTPVTPKVVVTPTQVPPAKTVTGMPNTGTGESQDGQIWLVVAGAAAITVIAAGIRKQYKA